MARRTYVLSQDFPDCKHENGTKTLADLGTLEQNKQKYPLTYRAIAEVYQFPDPDGYFQRMNVLPAAAEQAAWAGSGSGFGAGALCTSRNKIIGPAGLFDVNHAVPVTYGGFIGQGTGIATTNGNDVTHMRYDHARWIDPRKDRGILKSVNWHLTGTNYLESCVVDAVRLDGRGPGWHDPSYNQWGLLIKGMGENTVVGTFQGIYVHDCNNDGIWVMGAGPGKMGDITSFDSNIAGLRVTSVNSLGGIEISKLSCDNNGYAFYSDRAGAFTIGYLKHETGLSNQRGKPFKGQVPVFINGWCQGRIDLLTTATNQVFDAIVHFNNTDNGGRFEVAMLSGWGFANYAVDHRGGRRWAANANYQAIRMVARMQGTQSKLFVEPPGSVEVALQEVLATPVTTNGDRLGPVASASQYDYAAWAPKWDASGGAVAPPPPQAQWVVGPWSDWGPCVNGQQTRTRSVTSSIAGQTPIAPKPAESETQACVVTPPPPGVTGTFNPNDVLVVSNSADPRSAGWASAYAQAWGIPSANVISVNAGSGDVASAATVNGIRSAVNARAPQITVLAWAYPSRVDNGQSITDAVDFGIVNPGNLTVSPLFNYTGLRPRADKGFGKSFLLVDGKYIRRDAHATRPSGQAILHLAKDSPSQGNPRGSARAGQTAAGVTVWDMRATAIGGGQNACNYINNGCFLSQFRPGTTPIIAAYQSNFYLAEDGGIAWAKGFYGDHVTSVGGVLPPGAPPAFVNGAGQTCFVYHLERGASMSVGSVVEPWQGAGGSLTRQFVRVDLFHPRFVGGLPVGAAAYSAVECPGRMLFAGDPLCAPFAR